MKHTSITYFIAEHNISNYSFSINPEILSQRSILNYLVEWSKYKDIVIYSHAIRRQEENFEKYKDYHVFDGLKIPYCDWVYYLDIWYQEK